MIPEEPLQPGELKATILRYTSRWDEEDFHQSWNGTLNESNIFAVAAIFRKIFENKIFAIADFRYLEKFPDFDLRTDCYFNSQWTDGSKEMVRVKTGEYTHITFSAGGFLWSWDAAPGNQYDETYRYAHISFNGEQVEVKQRAPSRDLHAHIFRIQRDNNIEDTR